jgi:hypothetical protein
MCGNITKNLLYNYKRILSRGNKIDLGLFILMRITTDLLKPPGFFTSYISSLLIANIKLQNVNFSVRKMAKAQISSDESKMTGKSL